MVSYDSGANQWIRKPEGYARCIEYSNNGIIYKAIATELNSNMKQASYSLKVEFFIKDVTSSWHFLKEKAYVSKKGYYIDPTTGERLHKSLVYDFIDDLDHELMDEGGMTFDPPQYAKKPSLKAGYMHEPDFYTASFGPLLFDLFEQQIRKNEQITTL